MKHIFCCIIISFFVSACGDGSHDPSKPSTPQSEHLAIAGTWTDGSPGYINPNPLVISDGLWDGNEITWYDNTSRRLVHFSPKSDWAAASYVMVAWLNHNNQIYYCTEYPGHTTAEEARNATLTFDESDPATRGCGGSFPWSTLTPPSP